VDPGRREGQAADFVARNAGVLQAHPQTVICGRLEQHGHAQQNMAEKTVSKGRRQSKNAKSLGMVGRDRRRVTNPFAGRLTSSAMLIAMRRVVR
jgi:hypothetical protein